MIKSVYKLDPRIKDISDIQNPICYDNSFIGETCYFANRMSDFEDLESCDKGTLSEYIEDGYNTLGCFTAKEFQEDDYFDYFIPERLLKLVEYRPFSAKEFGEKFNSKIGEAIRLREIPSESGPSYEYKIVLSGFRWSKDSSAVYIGGIPYDFKKSSKVNF